MSKQVSSAAPSHWIRGTLELSDRFAGTGVSGNMAWMGRLRHSRLGWAVSTILLAKMAFSGLRPGGFEEAHSRTDVAVDNGL